jgi:hypothetical protein
MSKPRDRRNPAPLSAKHDIRKASTWSPSWSLSWYRSSSLSSSLSSSSERTPESRRKGCGRDVEKRRAARSLTATKETPGRLAPQAEPQPEPQTEPLPEVSRNSILGPGRRTRWPGRRSEWGAAGPPGGFVAGESISAFYLPSDRESTSGHHVKASTFMLSLPVPTCPDAASSSALTARSEQNSHAILRPRPEHSRRLANSDPLPSEDLARVANPGQSRRSMEPGLCVGRW